MVCRYPSVPPDSGGGRADPDPGTGEEAGGELEAETAQHLDRLDTFIWGIQWAIG